MNDNYFFDSTGERLLGKTPVQLFVSGSGDPGAVRAQANRVLHAVLDEVRLGGLSQLTRSYDLVGGATMTVRHSFGTTKVLLHLNNPSSTIPEPFYGGILIQPQTKTTSGWDIVPGVKFSGKTSTSPGRPAIPGVKETDVTDWLVVQIDPDATLGPSAIADGTVSIRRVKAPTFGLTSVPKPGEYAIAVKMDGAYIAGKKLSYVSPPPFMTAFDFHYAPASDATRMFAVDLEVPSFRKRGKTEVLLVVAYGGNLYILDTRSRTGSSPAIWQLLSVVESDPGYRYGDYAPTLNDTATAGVRTLSCAGTWAGGRIAGGFTVTAVKTPTGTTYSGVLLPAFVFVISEPAGRNIFDETYTVVECAEQVDAHKFAYRRFDDIGHPGEFTGLAGPTGTPTVVDVQQYDRHVAYKAYGYRREIQSSQTFAQTRGPVIDPILGRIRPGTSTDLTILRSSIQDATDFQGYHFRIKGWFLKDFTEIGVQGVMDFGVYFDYLSALWLGVMASPGQPAPNDRYMTYEQAAAYYSVADPLFLSDLTATTRTVGLSYANCWDLSGYYAASNKGLLSFASPPAGLTHGVTTATYVPVNRFGLAINDPDQPFYEFDLPAPHGSLSFLDGSMTQVGDVQLISVYPKRAAYFNTSESWSVSYSVTRTYDDGTEFSALLPFRMSFSQSATRVGKTRADEYFATDLPTNVPDAPELNETTYVVSRTDVGVIPVDGLTGEYDTDPMVKTQAYVRDVLTNAMCWRLDYERSGSWAFYLPATPERTFTARGDAWFAPLPYFREDANAMDLQLKLVKRDGTVVKEYVDFHTMLNPALVGPATKKFESDNLSRPGFRTPSGPIKVISLPAPELAPTESATACDLNFWDSDLVSHKQYVGLQNFDGADRPGLLVGYWNRWADGSGFASKFPTIAGFSPATPIVRHSDVPQSSEPEYYGSSAALFLRGAVPQPLDDVLLYDPRTKGFITQLYWDGFSEVLIGNEHGTTPFRPILEAWMNLGTGGMVPDGVLLISPFEQYNGLNYTTKNIVALL